MKHFYSQIKNFLNIALFLGIFLQSYLGNSQTTLVAGDLLFTGYDSSYSNDVGDVYSFVCLKTLNPGTVISFSDRGYYAPDGTWSAANSGEGAVTWTVAATVPAGTEVYIKSTNAYTFNPSTNTSTPNGTVSRTDGTMTYFGLALSGTGDQIYAFQGGSGVISNGGVTLIAGLHYNRCASGTTTAAWDTGCVASTNSSALKTGAGGLTGGTNAFYTGELSGAAPQAARFDNLTNSPLSTAAEIRTALMNQANWTLGAGTLTMPSDQPYLSTPTAITASPLSKTICPGSTTSFTVSATNATGYQWEVSTGSGYAAITNGGVYSGATLSVLTITGATSSMNGYSYRCVASGTGSATSGAATLTVPTAINSDVFSQSNVSTYGGNNGSATLTVSGGTSPYFYSWSPSGGTGLTANNLTAGTYTVTITDSTPNGLGGCTTTQNVVITQPAGSIVSTTSLSAFSSCGGASAEQSFTIQGGGLTSSLDVMAPTGFEIATSPAGIYVNNISYPNSGGVVTTKTIYARLASTATGTPSGNITISSTGITTKNVAVTGNMNTITFAGQPSPTGICTGGNATFSATAANATGYQWQVSTGSGFSNITDGGVYSGATTSTLSITGATAGMNGYLYRVTASGSCPSVNSNSAVLTINSVPAITSHPSAITICAGANTTFSSVAANATGYQWQVNTGAGSGFTNITNGAPYSNATTATLTITGATSAMNGYLYRLVATGSCSPDATSNDAALTINVAPSISSQPSDVSVCTNSNITFSATTANATGYQWQVNQGSGFGNIANGGVYSGATTSTLTITGATSSYNNFQYRLVATGSCTPAATSNSAVLKISNIQATSSQTDIACNGGNTGSLSVNPTGGIGTYTYLWSNGATTSSISNLTAGGYSVSIKDAILCEKTLNFTISEPAVLAASQGTVTNVSCYGGANGTGTVNVTGGTSGYTYSWAPSGGTAATATGLAAGTYTVTVTDAYSCQTTATVVIGQPAAALTATPSSQTNILCNGSPTGSATVAVTGGTPNYTYSWSPSGGTAATATGLTAGTYTVTVTDAKNCQTTQSFTITEPAVALTASASAQTNVLCNGSATGSATVAVTGGTGAYIYSWAPSGGTAATATGLTAGTYTVTVTDANNCQTTQSFTITQPAAALTASIGSQTSVSCNGGANGTATVAVTGGTGARTYSWAPYGGTNATANGLSAGTYTVTVTDANLCQATQSFTITQPAALVASVGSQTNVSCNGGSNGSATVSVTGGTGSRTYSWAPVGGTAQTATGLVAGTYTVTVTDSNSCQATQSFTITQPTSLTVTPSQTNVLCNGGSTGTATVTVSGGTPSYTYVWSPSGGTAPTATGLPVGNYTCFITDANGCSISQNFTIVQPAVLSATTSQINATCSTGGEATVIVSGGTTSYSYLWSPTGQTTATATGLAAGNHTVLVTDANGCTLTRNFTIGTTNTLVASAFQTNILCNGVNTGSAGVIPSGAPGPFTYVWAPSGGSSDTATNLAAGNYSVTITASNGCSIVKNFTITQPAALTTTPGSQTNVSCNGGSNGSASVTVTGGTGGYTYSWAPSGGTAATANGLAAGTYTVTVTDANLCTKTQSFTITEPAAIVATTSQTNVSCNGGTNGTATVNVTGGTGTYSYIWAPSGGTAATASGLTVGTYTVTITDASACQATATVTITEPAPLTATIASTNVTCNGGLNGTATVTPSGGTSPYTYSWSPSGGTAATASGLAVGTYTATITDANGCFITKTVTITEPTAIAITETHTNVLCNGGSDATATVTATGGTGSYSYSWAPMGGNAATASGLSAGTYTVTVTDANLCTALKTIVITQPSALIATTSQTNVSCNGGSNGTATVNTTGGTGAYSYSWAPFGGTAATASGLTAGTYTVTIKDANLCETTADVTIAEPAAITATITNTNVSCNSGSNGTATVNVIGGTGTYSYVWAPSGGTAATATGLAAGTYTVTITDANTCQATATVTITQPSLLTATVSKTDVSCSGSSDGTATVTPSGGTSPYTYSWSPSGGTAATAVGLSANTYTVTVTDANGCFVTQSVIIGTTPDITAPVPNVAVLPEITNYCSVLASQIPTSTATDNCVGTVNGTTTDPLNYNAVGTYTITWKYEDASGNTTTQTQTVKVVASPINAVTFTDAQFTYDGNAHSLQVANLPTGATVAYSANNGSTNAGTYAITATVTPAASSPNCSPIVLTANLIINKAAQQITFDAIPVKTLGANNSFNLTATSSSGLPVTYTFTYTSALAPATVSATGAVTMLRSGQGVITAHQAGNGNYLPATDVSQTLVILNNNIDVKSITLGNKVYDNPGKTIYHLLACGETNPNVSIVNESDATITPSANFTIQTPKPGIYTQNATITSQDGSTSAVYAITVEKPFAFFDIVHQKFNNVLLVNNNPQTNGGYEFVAYQWFKNGQPMGTGQYYSAGEGVSTILDPTADYSVKMTTKDGKVLQTCTSKITITNKLEAKLYPNPVQTGKIITVEADFPEAELQNMTISLYSITGQLVKTVQSSSVKTEIQLPPTIESSMYLVVLETPNVKKSFKVIVK